MWLSIVLEGRNTCYKFVSVFSGDIFFWENARKYYTHIPDLSVKWATVVQDYFTYAKVFALLIIIGTGLYMLVFNGKTANFNWQGTETDITVIGKIDFLSLSSIFTLFLFLYFYIPCYFFSFSSLTIQVKYAHVIFLHFTGCAGQVLQFIITCIISFIHISYF